MSQVSYVYIYRTCELISKLIPRAYEYQCLIVMSINAIRLCDNYSILCK